MNNGAEALLLLTMLVLPLSALLARRLPASRVIRLVAIWILIFAAATAAILLFQTWRIG
ncbi:hypothetical protein SAMN05428950_101807 [Sphingomonas sp. OV641]|uniref:hypothetical protein n=1 Tax=Sphingomonas sp. OV641 TaxID=1881068 RepID=UPI0008D1A83D|nr:hypothetical protein [Sphingomonas sp. OV641]SEI99849.1 hypothetical protein SAMN05428950_101807 [Sphingomonas sp. OV641]